MELSVQGCQNLVNSVEGHYGPKVRTQQLGSQRTVDFPQHRQEEHSKTQFSQVLKAVLRVRDSISS